MSQVGFMMSQCASEQFCRKSDEIPVYINECSVGRQSAQEVDDNLNGGDGTTANNCLKSNNFVESEIPREDEAPARDSIGDKIRLLKLQISALRASSIAFRENMESVLATIHGISQTGLFKPQWAPQTDSFEVPETKTLPHFRSSSGKKLITGIASRIERNTTSSESYQREFYERKARVPSEHTEITENINPLDITQDSYEQEAHQIPKRHIKVNESARPSSESFVTNNGNNNETADPLDDERTNSLPLSQNKDKKLPLKTLMQSSREVLDEAGSVLRASETSIDSGYHGGNTGRVSARVVSPASPLAKINDDELTERQETKPIVPTYLPVATDQAVYNLSPAGASVIDIDSVKFQQDIETPAEAAPALPPKRSQQSDAMKPRVPRQSSKIKMGVSSVTSPLPRARTIFPQSPTDERKTIMSEKKREDIKKDAKTTNDDDESSVLRRRSMRMMTEFKLFDFSDSSIGITSTVASTKPNNNASNNAKVSNTCQSNKNKPPVAKCDQTEKSKVTNKSKARRSSLKTRKLEGSFSSEPLPSPPLPPPPPAPPTEQTMQNCQVPEFTDFSSIARNSNKHIICKLQENTPVSSPLCVRKNNAFQSASQASLQKPLSITPSNGSAFTPVSMATWSDVSLDDLTSPGNYIDHTDPAHQARIDSNHPVQKPQPLYPRAKCAEEVLSKPESPFVFKRQGSLPLSAISNRNKYKQNLNSPSDSKLPPSVPIKRVQSLRERKQDNNTIAPSARIGRDLEIQPFQFSSNDNVANVVSALNEAGYRNDASWIANAGKNSRVERTSNFQRSASSIRSNKVVQNPVRERKEEVLFRPTDQQSERNGRTNKSTIDIIRASFRGRRGKSVPSASSTNAAHEFSTGIPTSSVQANPTGNKRDEQSAPPVSRKSSQNKVKQRVDLKPVTPIPAVEKSRRKKQAAEKSSKSGAGSSFYEKLRNAALKQQITNNNKKLADDKEQSRQRRRRLSSQTSEKSVSSHMSGKSRTGDSYPSGSLASNTSMSSYNSLNASISSAKKINKKSTFV